MTDVFEFTASQGLWARTGGRACVTVAECWWGRMRMTTGSPVDWSSQRGKRQDGAGVLSRSD